MLTKTENIKSLQKKINEYEQEIEALNSKISGLNNSLELNKIALESSNNCIQITDANGKILWVNQAFLNKTGFKFEEVINQNPRILNSNFHDKKFFNDLWETIKKGKVWKGEIVNRKKNGDLFYEEQIITPITNSKNEITNFIATKNDITNIKETHHALNESYIKYEELAYIFNQSPAVGFLISAQDYKTVEFITDNIKQFGYSPSQFYSQKLNFADLIFHEDKNLFFENIENTISEGEERLKIDFRILTKDNTLRWVDVHIYFHLGENDSITKLQGVLLDVTEKRMAEEESKVQLEQLMQADKMIALGTLVSGVAHEINNPNNVVLLNTPILEKMWNSVLPILDKHAEKEGDFFVGNHLKYSKIKSKMPQILSGIFDGSVRIKTIVQDLKNFARKDSAGFNQEVSVNEVIKSSSNLISNLISKSTDNFSITYCEENPIILGNKQKLEQVLINIIENSCQAIESRKKAIKVYVHKNDEFVNIIVEDEGSGIKPALLRKITNPFFTTKRNSGGTGLGLSITSKIVNQHNGSLVYESEVEKGTKAILSLPLLEMEKNDE